MQLFNYDDLLEKNNRQLISLASFKKTPLSHQWIYIEQTSNDKLLQERNIFSNYILKGKYMYEYT